MATNTIATMDARVRERTGSTECKRIREEGDIPAVIYGRGRGNVPCRLNLHDFRSLLRENEQFLDLNVEGNEHSVFIKDVQYDALGDTILHVDFIRVSKTEKLEVEIPVRVFGKSKGEKEGGYLEIPHPDIAIMCLPTEIPEEIKVDVREMEIHDVVRAGDLELPDNIDLAIDEDTTVITCRPPIVIEEEPEEEEFEMLEPELIGREPEEEEGEEFEEEEE